MYGDFDLTIPATLQEALAVLDMPGQRRVALSGGTNVLLDIRAQKLAPDMVVGLGNIAGLRTISVAGGRVSLGGRTTVSDLLAAPDIARTAPALLDAARVFAGQMVRNAATVAGNIAGCRGGTDQRARQPPRRACRFPYRLQIRPARRQ